jgi:hypothetical protein
LDPFFFDRAAAMAAEGLSSSSSAPGVLALLMETSAREVEEEGIVASSWKDREEVPAGREDGRFFFMKDMMRRESEISLEGKARRRRNGCR